LFHADGRSVGQTYRHTHDKLIFAFRDTGNALKTGKQDNSGAKMNGFLICGLNESKYGKDIAVMQSM